MLKYYQPAGPVRDVSSIPLSICHFRQVSKEKVILLGYLHGNYVAVAIKCDVCTKT